MNDWDSTIRATFADTQALDLHRQRLLRYARISSLPMLLFRIDTLHYTVLPRLLKSPLAWLVLVFYTVSAALARTGVWEVSYDPNALSGSGMLVSFMIVFYVGYCYNRHFQQYEVCTAAQGAVVSCCLLARANLPHAEDRQLLWSCLNLAHAAGYCGLTPTYNVDNLFFDFCVKHSLFPTEPTDRCGGRGGGGADAERGGGEDDEGRGGGAEGGRGAGDTPTRVADEARRSIEDHLREVDVDKGKTAYRECLVWALEVLATAHARGELASVQLVEMQSHVLALQRHITALYNWQWQVMPYIYMHLISVTTALYMFIFAADKGLLFLPQASYTYGLVVPAFSTVLSTSALFGLMEVGATLANPCGDEAEDFAVLSFIEAAAEGSRRVLAAPSLLRETLWDRSRDSRDTVKQVQRATV